MNALFGLSELKARIMLGILKYGSSHVQSGTCCDFT